MKFDEDIKDAKFYIANMGNGTAEAPQYPFEPTQQLDGSEEAMYAIPMQPGYELVAKIVVRAVGTTKRGNPFQVRQAFPVIIR